MRTPLIKWVSRMLMSLGALLLLATLLFVGGNLWVLGRTAPYIHEQLSQCVPAEVGVVFGTSHWTRSGMRNPHFHARMRTAARLVDQQKYNTCCFLATTALRPTMNRAPCGVTYPAAALPPSS